MFKHWIAHVVFIIICITTSMFGVLKCVEVKRLQNDLTLNERSFVEMKRLRDNLVISSSRMVTKETFDKEVKELTAKNKELAAILQEKQTKVLYKTVIKTMTKYIEVKDKVSDKVEKTKTETVYHKEVVNDAGLSIADVKFKHPSSKPWSYRVHPLQTKITVIHAEQNGVPKIVVETTQTDHKNRTKPLKLVDVSTIIRRPEIKPFKFGVNPFQLELYALYGFHQGKTEAHGAGFGLGTHVFHLDVKERTMFRFVGFVAGYQAGAVSLSFHPASFNLGVFIPILKDTYITIGVGGAFILKDQVFSPLISIGIGSTL